ncbi:Avirulence (Avh) protein [Phytophthora megakarya]|uniref:Avirulence (Avh) protein n=1 Tax=Phytophthora megakarya TaxID=4795 RepID=A0A225V732_9STRA|nr:Avirulence (Avh) protein [Phytophthora megakarya]
MRLYHVLLATAAALVASNNGFVTAENCYIMPQETEVPATAAPAGSFPNDAYSGSTPDFPLTQNSNPGSDVGASQASNSNNGDTKQGLPVSSSSNTPSSVDASQKTDVASSSETAGEADKNTPLTFTEAPKPTTIAPTITSTSGSGSIPTIATNSTSNSTTPSTSTTSADNSKLCAKPRIQITEVDVGATVENNEDEAALKVVAIAALPSGGSRIAFQSGDNVIVRELDANDKLVSSSPAVKVPLHDFADIYADKNGFVILGTRDAEGGGTLNCGNPSNLCGTAPDPAVPCYDMYMARYDGSKESWATKLTSSSTSLPPYSSSATGPDVYMIWWYAHHGRIASDGKNWAAYFGAAISTSEGGCINIHQGDRMKVVDPTGKITADQNSFDWGCSHSGYERITYDNRTSSYAAICKTDSNNRIMPPQDWDTTIYPVDLAASNLGDIVPDSVASSKKYWATVSNGNGDNAKVHLIHFDLKSKASEDITLGGSDANERAPHLARIGNGGMLAMWEGSSQGGDLQEGGERTIYAQVLDASTGKAISSKVTVDKSVVGNRYQALKSYPDGSVAYLSKGKTDTSVQVVRFFGC